MTQGTTYTNHHKSLIIGWLYPVLMSTYGDRGNIICLQKRAEWRGVEVTTLPIDESTDEKLLLSMDLLFGGGAQDVEQEIVIDDLKGKKAKTIYKLVENGLPSLFVCGAPQIMGNYYEPAVGKRIEGLGIFDMVTENPGQDASRLIGNIVAQVQWEYLMQGTKYDIADTKPIVGFENHGGRTRLGPSTKPFAKVIKGFGNNGEDGTEGVVYKNAIGCYFHGPLLPKNPHVADWLIKKALEVKYREEIILSSLDDSLEWQAHDTIVRRLGLGV